MSNKTLPPFDQEDGYWYRFERVRFSRGVDQWDMPLPGHQLKVHLHRYRVVKYTPKGVRLGNGKFVLLDGRKQFASQTIKRAYDGFQARTHKHIAIMQSRIDDAEDSIAITNKFMAGSFNDISVINL